MPVAHQRDGFDREARSIGLLLQPSQTWQKRLEGLRKLRQLADIGDIADGRVTGWVAASTRPLIPVALAQLEDGRAALHEEACSTLCFMATQFGGEMQRYENEAAHVFTGLLHYSKPKQRQGLQTWLRHVQVGSMAPVAMNAFADQHNKALRARAMECIVYFLEQWSPEMLRRHLPALQRCTDGGVTDRTPAIRSLAQRAAALLAEHRGKRAPGAPAAMAPAAAPYAAQTPAEWSAAAPDAYAIEGAGDDIGGDAWAPFGMVQMEVAVAPTQRQGGPAVATPAGGAQQQRQRRRNSVGVVQLQRGGRAPPRRRRSDFDRTADWVEATTPPAPASAGRRGDARSPSRAQPTGAPLQDASTPALAAAAAAAAAERVRKFQLEEQAKRMAAKAQAQEEEEAMAARRGRRLRVKPALPSKARVAPPGGAHVPKLGTQWVSAEAELHNKVGAHKLAARTAYSSTTGTVAPSQPHLQPQQPQQHYHPPTAAGPPHAPSYHPGASEADEGLGRLCMEEAAMQASLYALDTQLTSLRSGAGSVASNNSRAGSAHGFRNDQQQQQQHYGQQQQQQHYGQQQQQQQHYGQQQQQKQQQHYGQQYQQQQRRRHDQQQQQYQPQQQYPPAQYQSQQYPPAQAAPQATGAEKSHGRRAGPHGGTRGGGGGRIGSELPSWHFALNDLSNAGGAAGRGRLGADLFAR